MATKKPERRKLTHEEALRALLFWTQRYTQAAAAHFDASLYSDPDGVGEANKEAEAAYSELCLSIDDAKRSLS